MMSVEQLESEMQAAIALFLGSDPTNRISHFFNIEWDDHFEIWRFKESGTACGCPVSIFVRVHRIPPNAFDGVFKSPVGAIQLYAGLDDRNDASAIWAGFDDACSGDDEHIGGSPRRDLYQMGRRLHQFVIANHVDQHWSVGHIG